jgi:hypothetical protein
MDQHLAGGSREERSDDIGISNVGQLDALPGEAMDVLAESFIWLLAAALEVPRVARAHIGALEVPYENLYKVSPVVDASGRKVLKVLCLVLVISDNT